MLLRIHFVLLHLTHKQHNANANQNFVKSFWRPSFIHYICKANSCKKLHSNFWRPSFILYSQYNPRSTYKFLRQGVQQQHSRAVYTYFTRKFAYCQAIYFTVAVPACVLFAESVSSFVQFAESVSWAILPCLPFSYPVFKEPVQFPTVKTV